MGGEHWMRNNLFGKCKYGSNDNSSSSSSSSIRKLCFDSFLLSLSLSDSIYAASAAVALVLMFVQVVRVILSRSRFILFSECEAVKIGIEDMWFCVRKEKEISIGDRENVSFQENIKSLITKPSFCVYIFLFFPFVKTSLFCCSALSLSDGKTYLFCYLPWVRWIYFCGICAKKVSTSDLYCEWISKENVDLVLKGVCVRRCVLMPPLPWITKLNFNVTLVKNSHLSMFRT